MIATNPLLGQVVRTVNGKTPDTSGNVNIDIPATQSLLIQSGTFTMDGAGWLSKTITFSTPYKTPPLISFGFANLYSSTENYLVASITAEQATFQMYQANGFTQSYRWQAIGFV